MKTKIRLRIGLSALLLCAGIASMIFGFERGEAKVVSGKATRICLECIGIG